MLSGIINTENISQVLREISQKRRHGVLEIKSDRMHREVLFVAGKIVEFREAGFEPAREVAETLRRSGFDTIPPQAELPASYSEVFAVVSNALEGEGVMNDSLFKLVIKHRILNKLYALDVSAGAVYGFTAQMVEYERDWCPSISVGQLLLDFVALQSDGHRLDTLFPRDKVLSRSGNLPTTTFSEEEQIIFHLLGTPISRSDLERVSMLSAYAIQDALLGMHERGLVQVGDAAVIADEASAQSSLEGAHTDQATEEGVEITDAANNVESDETNTEFTSAAVPLQVQSMQLLHAPWVPRSLAFVIVISAVVAPWLWWSGVLRGF